MTLRPFWRYYGGKWRAAPRYPAPRFGHIVEPFAGAAGYALRHHRLAVTLVDAYPPIAGVWRYLIAVRPAEVLAIPLVDAVADLPSWVPQEARWLVGWQLNEATTWPSITLSAGVARKRAEGAARVGWDAAQRDLVASQVEHIRHWRIIEGDYTDAPDIEATWFIDPPYNNRAGRKYPRGARDMDFNALGTWCRTRRGHVMVCENAGADWLPFEPFEVARQSINGGGATEVLWQSTAPRQPLMFPGRP